MKHPQDIQVEEGRLEMWPSEEPQTARFLRAIPELPEEDQPDVMLTLDAGSKLLLGSVLVFVVSFWAGIAFVVWWRL